MVRPLMRAPIRGAIAFVSCLALQLSSADEARAQECSNPLVSTCINADGYWPHAGPQRFAAVGSAETLEPIDTLRGSILVPLAVSIGTTRLIDNVILKLEE